MIDERYLAIAAQDGDFAIACLYVGPLANRPKKDSSQTELQTMKINRNGDKIVDEEDRLCGHIQEVWNASAEATPWIAGLHATPRTWTVSADAADLIVVMF